MGFKDSKVLAFLRELHLAYLVTAWKTPTWIGSASGKTCGSINRLSISSQADWIKMTNAIAQFP